MAVPPVPPDRQHRELPLPEARVRLTQLVRLTAVADQVTVITDGGRPAAALVPVDAARTRADVLAASAHARATAAGWMKRLDAVRAALRGQHAAETRELHRELREAWHLLDRVSPPGADRAVDTARAARRTR
jgi:antitoxin (DNA-binding transcriptional repressor) of toxin-antitoxin stability system